MGGHKDAGLGTRGHHSRLSLWLNKPLMYLMVYLPGTRYFPPVADAAECREKYGWLRTLCGAGMLS